MLIKDILRTITFGQRVAEEEFQRLAEYFVETDQWKRILRDEIDIVYGSKGSGKSALYGLLLERKDALFDAGVLVLAAENPRDTPAFRELVVDPPATEREFEALWKLYFLCLLGQVLADYSVNTPEARRVLSALQDIDLLPRDHSLRSLLRAAVTYIRRQLRIESVETGLQVNPVTGLPEGVTGKVTLREPAADARLAGATSIDELFRLADIALSGIRYVVWIALDRLDVAFSEDQVLEERALRALFRVYLDLRGLGRVRFKVFLRTDIWSRITRQGFREASHVTKSVIISWNSELLLNLIVRRLLSNEPVRDFYKVDPDKVLNSAAAQQNLFYRVFPESVGRGRGSLKTIDWIISRTQDGLQQPSPREVIHLLNHAREIQVQRLEVGRPAPSGGLLFHRGVIADALPEVSKVRLEQTVYAEYPGLQGLIEALKHGSSVHTPASLSRLWATSAEDATRIATQLVGAGVLHALSSKGRLQYEVPYLYHDALGLEPLALQTLDHLSEEKKRALKYVLHHGRTETMDLDREMRLSKPETRALMKGLKDEGFVVEEARDGSLYYHVKPEFTEVLKDLLV